MGKELAYTYRSRQNTVHTNNILTINDKCEDHHRYRKDKRDEGRVLKVEKSPYQIDDTLPWSDKTTMISTQESQSRHTNTNHKPKSEITQNGGAPHRIKTIESREPPKSPRRAQVKNSTGRRLQKAGTKETERSNRAGTGEKGTGTKHRAPHKDQTQALRAQEHDGSAQGGRRRRGGRHCDGHARTNPAGGTADDKPAGGNNR